MPRAALCVDIEVRAAGRDFDGIGDRVYSLRERRVLSRMAGGAKAALFYRLWTLKAALIEALCTGLSPDPSRFDVQRPMLEGECSAVFLFTHRPFDPYWLEDPGEPRFVAGTAPQLPLGEVSWA